MKDLINYLLNLILNYARTDNGLIVICCIICVFHYIVKWSIRYQLFKFVVIKSAKWRKRVYKEK